jgi:hypothetical protein
VDPPGSAVYERLHYWLHNCVHNHEHKEIQEGTLPWRILDVQCDNIKEDQIRLMDVLENEMKYVALSHC